MRSIQPFLAFLLAIPLGALSACSRADHPDEGVAAGAVSAAPVGADSGGGTAGSGGRTPWGGATSTGGAISKAGKEYWQTEVDTGRASDDPTGDNMPTALRMAEEIHNHLTRANLNAWHYWWLWAGGTSGVFNTETNVWTKRLWLLGNFSRFVRPGYLRVSTTGDTPSGVLISAYTNPADGTVVVVAINKNTSATPVSVFVSGAAPCEVTPWVTSDADSLAAREPITLTEARFATSLEAGSVTTFVGTP